MVPDGRKVYCSMRLRNAPPCVALAPWLLLVAVALGACTEVPDAPAPAAVQTAFVTVRRAWFPGERDSMIAHIVASRALSFPYVGDLSDNANEIFRTDSVDAIVPNPDLAPAATAPLGLSAAPMVPGTGWTTAGVDVRIINTTPTPDDTVRWLGWFWYNSTTNTQKGYAFAFVQLPATTVAATSVNTTTFDAAFGKSGAGGGEVTGNPPGNTYWQANGWTRRNTLSVTASLALGGTSTVTTGPFLGGTQQTLLMSGVLDSVRLDRVSGSGTPVTQYASITLNLVGSIRYSCTFPSPCTTNVLLLDPSVRARLLAGRTASAGRP